MSETEEKLSVAPLRCPWCGHVRCPDCNEDRWPQIADGCCACAARLLEKALRALREVC